MGSVDRAADGTLTVLAGGDVDRVARILAVFGTVVRCGGLGAGAARKILLINAAIGAVAPAADLTELGTRLGVPDPLDLLAEGPLAGAVARLRAEEADFPLRLAVKDVGLALDVTASPVLEAVRERLEYAQARLLRFSGTPPTSMTVEVSRLFVPGALLEVEVTAMV
jgi:3-hydroxyisobutyrate dehydrogenase